MSAVDHLTSGALIAEICTLRLLFTLQVLRNAVGMKAVVVSAFAKLNYKRSIGIIYHAFLHLKTIGERLIDQAVEKLAHADETFIILSSIFILLRLNEQLQLKRSNRHPFSQLAFLR